MNILFVTLNPVDTNSSAMIRNRALINGFLENECNIEVLTIPVVQTLPSYDTSMKFDKSIIVSRLYSNNVYRGLIKSDDTFIGGLKTKMVPIFRYAYHKFSLFDNTINYVSAVNTEVLQLKKYDIVISSSDPKSSHYVVKRLIEKGLNYKKWIQYWGDPMTIDITNKTALPKRYIKYRENEILKLADRIIYVSKFTLNNQKKLFPKLKEKMFFLPIPYLQKKLYPLKKNIIKNFNVSYLGDYHSKIRNLKPLYETLVNLKEEGFSFTVAGNTDLHLAENSNIKILPRVNQNVIEHIEKESDLLVCILNKQGTQIPGKLYHYAATNKPILVVLDGEISQKEELKNYLMDFNRYIICDNNFDQLRSKLLEIKKNYNLLDNEPSPFFEPAVIAKKFLEISL